MTPQLKLVGGTQSTTEGNQQPKTSDEIDFDALFTPSSDFDQQLKQEVSSPSSPSSLPNQNPFPELTFDIQVDCIIEQSEPVSSKPDVTSRLGGADFSSFRLIADEAPLVELHQQETPEIRSVLEEYSSLYTIRFQEILKNTSNVTPQESIQRYAKILLYILEQFHIHGEKKTHVKFMTYLKTILEPSISKEDLEAYTQSLIGKGYMIPRPELQEEVETLFNIYYENFQEAKNQLKEIKQREEQASRSQLLKNIALLEKEFDDLLEENTPVSPDGAVSYIPTSSDSSSLSSSLSMEIEQRRWQLAQRRAQRDSQSQGLSQTKSDEI